MRDMAYLQLLAREYPSVKEATSEIINLMAICNLPKGTEYFFSDLHGEYEAFIHLLRSSSGIIREKIKETFGHLIPEEEQLQLANLIYYPERHLPRMMKMGRYTEAGYIQHHSIHSCQKIMPHPLIWHFHVLIITMDPYLHEDPGLNSDQKHTCQKPDQAFILFVIIHLKLLPFYLVFNLCTVYH